MIRGALASRYGISPLGRGVIRPASGGWWLSGGIAAANCIAAYQPKGAADYAASKVNLANPGTYNAADGNAPGWDATNGWKFDGTNDYLSTGIVPTIDQTWSAFIRFSNGNNEIGGGSGIFGLYESSTKVFTINPMYLADRMYWGHGASWGIVWGQNGLSGVWGFSARKLWKDAVNISTTAAGTASTTLDITIGKSNGTTTYMKLYVQALAIFNTTITDTQVGLLTTAMAAL